MRIHKDSVFYAAAMFTFSSVGLQLMSFIYRIAMSRFIGAEGMGVFGLVMPVYAVVQSFTLSGLVLAVTRRSAKYEALGRISAVRATLRQSMAVYVVLFAAAALPVLLLNQSIAERVLGDARTRIALLILLPCMLLTGFENLLKAHFQGTRFILPPIVSELSEQFIRIIAVVTLLYLFRGASAGVSASLIVTGMIISEVSSVV
ncbi:MAG: oligosaccharide flippase family protein, partial [Acetanaerobacterium sp.]